MRIPYASYRGAYAYAFPVWAPHSTYANRCASRDRSCRFTGVSAGSASFRIPCMDSISPSPRQYTTLLPQLAPPNFPGMLMDVTSSLMHVDHALPAAAAVAAVWDDAGFTNYVTGGVPGPFLAYVRARYSHMAFRIGASFDVWQPRCVA